MSQPEPETICPYELIERLQEANSNLAALLQEAYERMTSVNDQCIQFREYAETLAGHAQRWQKIAKAEQEKSVMLTEQNDSLKLVLRTLFKYTSDRVEAFQRSPIYLMVQGALNS